MSRRKYATCSSHLEREAVDPSLPLSHGALSGLENGYVISTTQATTP